MFPVEFQPVGKTRFLNLLKSLLVRSCLPDEFFGNR